jgi:predicted short-subunit dehydrogenase-like oxidoreductase (DUF2520 family)
MRIVLLGTGNLATRLGIALHAKNAEIVQVYGRTGSSASNLAEKLGCSPTTSLKEIDTTAEIYILAVSDGAIAEIASNIPIGNRLIVHTAGSIDMDVFAPYSDNYGVFYPLQTLSRDREVDFSLVPVCIEANHSSNLEKLNQLASLLSDTVIRMDSEHRRHLHLAAVFVCNFVNHFYTIGEKLLQETQLDFDLLKPIILETANKAMQYSPLNVQTGPAIRGDKHILVQHLKMLAQHPEWQRLYEMVSEDIMVNRRGDPLWSPIDRNIANDDKEQ